MNICEHSKNAGIVSTSLENITRFDGNRNDYVTWRKGVLKYFLVADIADNRKARVAYQLSTGKADDLIKQFLQSVPGVTWNELRGLLDRSYVGATDPVEAMHRIANIKQQGEGLLTSTNIR